MGNYSDGRFAWVTKDLVRIRPGIPLKGLQGLKPISTEGLRMVNERLSSVTG
jgi:hypothetical protein